jgi:plasmid stability protein
LTIRNLPPELVEMLEREKHRRGQSLNQTVIDLLRDALSSSSARSNGLGRMAGDWSQQEFGEFAGATAQFEQADDELWS